MKRVKKTFRCAVSRSGTLLMLGLLALCLNAPTAYALQRYRCGDKVQYTPCYFPVSNVSLERAASVRRTVPPVQRKAPRIVPSGNVSIINQSFQRLTTTQGLWKGRVKAEGKVHLYLRIVRNGVVETTKYIGNVIMRPHEQPTKFNFKSSLPAGSGWSWSIVGRLVQL